MSPNLVDIFANAHLNPEFLFQFIFKIYDPSHQKYDDKIGKWVVDGPRVLTVELGHIRGFREVENKDLQHNTATDSHFPGDYCIMEYYDKWDKCNKIAFVAGSLKETLKYWKEARDKISKAYKEYEGIKGHLEKEFDDAMKPILAKF